MYISNTRQIIWCPCKLNTRGGLFVDFFYTYHSFILGWSFVLSLPNMSNSVPSPPDWKKILKRLTDHRRFHRKFYIYINHVYT